MTKIEAREYAKENGFTLEEAMEYIDNNAEAEKKVNSLLNNDNGIGFWEAIFLVYKR